MDLIVNILILYSGTVLISITINVETSLKFFKKIVENGYKWNHTNYYESDEDSIEDVRQMFSSIFIPFYNIFYHLIVRDTLLNDESEFQELILSNYIIELSEEEKKYYREKPTIFRAYTMNYENEDLINYNTIDEDDTVLINKDSTEEELNEINYSQYCQENCFQESDFLENNMENQIDTSKVRKYIRIRKK